METLFDAALGRFWMQKIWSAFPMTCHLAACLVVLDAQEQHDLDEEAYRELIDQITKTTGVVIAKGRRPPFQLHRLGWVVVGSLTRRMLLIEDVQREERLRIALVNKLRQRSWRKWYKR